MKTLLQEIWKELNKFFLEILDAAPLLIIALVLTMFYFWLSKKFRRRFITYLQKKADDPLQINFLSEILRMVNWIIGGLVFLFIIGKQNVISSILGAGAISAFVIGFAFKDIGENFLAGIILAFKRPFKIGDIVMIQDIEGSIVGLDLRETHMKTFDGKDVYIPNGMIIKNPLYNYTIDGFLRQQFILSFDYGTDLQLARKVLLDTVNKIPGVLQDSKSAKTLIQDPGAYKISIITQYWINTINSPQSSSEIKSMVIKDSMEELAKENIEITGQRFNFEEITG